MCRGRQKTKVWQSVAVLPDPKHGLLWHHLPLSLLNDLYNFLTIKAQNVNYVTTDVALVGELVEGCSGCQREVGDVCVYSIQVKKKKKEALQKQFATVLKQSRAHRHSEAGHYDLNLNIDDIKHNSGLCNFAL